MESAKTLPLGSEERVLPAPTGRARRRGQPGAGGVVLGRYRLLHPLGAGGFGVVWLAHDERLDREVAVKRIEDGTGVTTPSGRLSARVRREARAAARLSHPAIVAIYEAAGDQTGLYLVSELVRGRTLAEAEHEGELSDRDVVAIGVALCDALAHAHARGVVHRDLKPGNVIVPDPEEDDAPVPAKLTDFGIAHLVGDDALTRTGDVMGTLAYMAPEQAEGRRVGPAADLYSLGVVLYEAFAGTNPVRGAPLAPGRRARRLPHLGRVRRDLPGDLCRAVDAAVSARPEERGSVRALRTALVQAAQEVGYETGAVAAAPLESLVARPRGPRLGVGARAGAAVGAALLAALVLWKLAPAGGPGPAAGAASAAIAIALLPRAGWVGLAAALVAWIAAAGQAGLALVCAAALFPIPLLLPTAPAAWSLPALAPVLGVAGLAGGFPALAGRARTAVQRAALGALGLWWVLAAEVALQARLLAGPPGSTRPREGWEASASEAFQRVLEPLASGGLLAVAAVWATAALGLPWLVRGRALRLDALGAALWSICLAVATLAIATGATARPSSTLPREALAGAVLAVLLALAGRRTQGAR